MKNYSLIKLIPFSALLILFSFYGCEKEDSGDNTDTITDIDGNVYNIVTIGIQVWFKENLKTTKYNDGTPIDLVTDNTEWHKLDTAGYCWYNNDQATYGNTYGALYNWYTAEPGNLCPSGWHVPTDAEWTTLVDYLGGSSVAGGKMKETGTTHWKDPNEDADNESRFTALPGGSRSNVYGNFHDLEIDGSWWSQPKLGDTSPRTLYTSFNNSGVSRGTSFKDSGHSVRCIKD